ncbi:hypothetical protein BGZ63DRAFT_197303 [Mariannaea sp. PMI_226]|nr:hypothetical protein BGZ63DRAFT_197303 [Mariannaea sp. PMI_226]
MDPSFTTATASEFPPKSKEECRHRSRIVVEIPSKHPHYVPGAGPPPQRISLLPAQDTTAYILERILLPSPGLAADGKPLPKRMAYIVSWHDLPAARMLVPAMEVLDYVSPRALEDWEYEMELETDKVRARIEVEKHQHKPKKMKRGRPPLHSKIEAAVVIEPVNEALKTGRPAGGAMSITTPSKKRMTDFEDISEDWESPSRQLEAESRSSVDNELNLTGPQHATPREDTASKLFKPDLRREPEPGPVAHSSQDKITSNIQVTIKSRAPTVVESIPKPPLNTPALCTTNKVVRETPIPLPNIPGFSLRPSVSDWSVQRTPSSTQMSGSTFFSPSNQVVEQPTGTPWTTLVATATIKQKSDEDSSKKRKKERKKEPKKTVDQKTHPPLPSSKGVDHQPEPEDEPAWEVKRIEETELFEIEGKGLVRYFKILWEGDWPPDQNPSWEPEENLPPSLVRNFMKKVQKKPGPKRKSLKQQSILPWATGSQFKSVSEAFAGGEDFDLLAGPAYGADLVHDGDEYADQEEFVVVEEPPAKKKKARTQGSLGWNRTATQNGSSSGRAEFDLLTAFH